MKIVIVGGGGFIGSAVSNSLKNNHDITVFDTKSPVDKTVGFFHGDVMNPGELEKATKKCDTVLHLAAFLGVRETEENPLKTLDVNIQGTYNVLNACIKNNVKRVVFSSSSEVYGNAEHVPISENERLAPVSNYGISKVVAESYIRAFSNKFDLEYVILRYFNVYGPLQRADFVIPKMVRASLENTPIKIYGNGEQIRAFTHVSDAVEGTLLAMEKGKNDVFNIGNDREPISIKNLASLILKITGSESKIEFVPLDKSDRNEKREIFKRIPDITKARSVLGYRPKMSLESGIKEVAEVMRE
jgi:UDP-glucose 4-epimerase